jgi:large repetitive protein
MVYNTNSGFGSGIGIYYWDGKQWNFLNNSTSLQSGWLLTGNAGTTASTSPIGTGVNNNFIGTTDSNDVVIASNNLERIRVTGSGNVGIGTISPSASALLQMSSTTQGISFPSMTTVQRNAIPTATIIQGLTIYNTSTGCLEFYVGSNWQPIACGCTVPPANPVSIISSDPAATLCPDVPHTFSIAPVPGAYQYIWTVSPGVGANLDGTGINTETTTATYVQSIFSSGGPGTISVEAINACGNSSTISLPITVTPAPAPPVFSASPDTVCAGTAYLYSIEPVTYAAGYIWTAPTGANINGTGSSTYTGTLTSVNIVFASTSGPTPGTVTVSAGNNCGTSATASTPVSVNSIPAVPVFNLDPTPVCSMPASTIYAVNPITNAITYNWAGTGIIFNGTASPYSTNLSSLNIIFPAGPAIDSFTVSATNGCGTSLTQSSGPVMVTSVPAAPADISGFTGYCNTPNLNTYSIPALPQYATAVTWTAPAGADINGTGTNTYTGTSTTITVDFGTAVPGGVISVYGTGTCGTGPTTSTAVLSPLPVPTPGTITGSAAICSGAAATYTLTGSANGTSYTWSVPAGDIITQSGSNVYTETTLSQISVTGAVAGNVTVTVNNCNGSSDADPYPFSINTVPSFSPGTVISASAAGPYIENQLVTFTISNPAIGATGYTWTVPPGASIVSGAGTATIVANMGTSSGINNTVSLVASNSCGNTSAITLPVTSCYTTGIITFNYTGGLQTYTVPNPCVTAITVTVTGAQGGTSYSNGQTIVGMGLNGGAQVTAAGTYTPGTVLNVYVGGAGGSATANNTNGIGGTNGSGNGSGGAGGLPATTTISGSGGGGGASSELWIGATRVVVAGGGGGGGADFDNFYAPGSGGQTGGAGSASSVVYDAAGAPQSGAVAAGGINAGAGSVAGSAGATAATGIGGNGGFNTGDFLGQSIDIGFGGGGGGGGWYGGGGGCDGAGGGGSSNYQPGTGFVPTSATYTPNANASGTAIPANGTVTISW